MIESSERVFELMSHKANVVCEDRATRIVFAEGEFGGTLCMWSHISVHGATAKFCDNPFVFKNAIEKEGLPRDSTPGLGAGGSEFSFWRRNHSCDSIHGAQCFYGPVSFATNNLNHKYLFFVSMTTAWSRSC